MGVRKSLTNLISLATIGAIVGFGVPKKANAETYFMAHA
jgi:hypothetical protein